MFYKNHIASNPGSRLVTYMELLDEGRYDEMYDMLDKASQKSISKKILSGETGIFMREFP